MKLVKMLSLASFELEAKQKEGDRKENKKDDLKNNLSLSSSSSASSSFPSEIIDNAFPKPFWCEECGVLNPQTVTPTFSSEGRRQRILCAQPTCKKERRGFWPCPSCSSDNELPSLQHSPARCTACTACHKQPQHLVIVYKDGVEMNKMEEAYLTACSLSTPHPTRSFVATSITSLREHMQRRQLLRSFKWRKRQETLCLPTSLLDSWITLVQREIPQDEVCLWYFLHTHLKQLHTLKPQHTFWSDLSDWLGEKNPYNLASFGFVLWIIDLEDQWGAPAVITSIVDYLQNVSPHSSSPLSTLIRVL